MGIINRLVLKNIKTNLKRTVLTVIGIAIATSLISGALTIFSSTIYSMRKTVIDLNGKYHIQFMNIDTAQRKEIYDRFYPYESYEEVEVKTPEEKKVDKYEDNEIFLTSFSTEGFKQNSINLSEGQYPTNINEIIVPNEYMKKNNLNIGDKIDINGEKTIVGTMKDARYYSSFNKVSYAVGLIDENNKEKFNYYVYFDKLTDSIIKDAEKFANINNISYSINSSLISYSMIKLNSDAFMTMFIFFIILFIIISIASISLTYNSFSISVNQRRRELSILGCCGATKRQLKKTVYREVLFLGIIGTFLGIGGGFLGIYITFNIINHLIGNMFKDITLFTFYADVKVIIFTIILTAITLAIAAYFPARRAKGVSLIECVRGNDGVISKKTLKAIKKKNRLSKFLAGIEGLIASRNISRMKKQYRVIIASLVVSVVIFLVSTSFMSIMMKSVKTNYGDSIEKSSNVLLYGEYKDDETLRDIINENKSDLESYIHYYNLSIYDQEKGITYNLSIYNDYENISLTKEELDGGVFVKNGVTANDEGKFNFTYTLKNGEMKNIEIPYKKTLVKLDLGSNIPTIIISRSTANNIFGDFNPEKQYIENVLQVKAKENVAEKVAEKIHLTAEENDLREINLFIALKLINLTKTIIYIFVYGFVGLVSLVAIVNMINTVISSIQNRVKEIGVLRSVGMSKIGMLKMLLMENLIVILKTFIISIGIWLIVHYLMISSVSEQYKIEFFIDYIPLLIVISALVIFTILPTLYATVRIRKSNIIESLR